MNTEEVGQAPLRIIPPKYLLIAIKVEMDVCFGQFIVFYLFIFICYDCVSKF